MSRREFLARTALVSSAAALGSVGVWPGQAADRFAPPISVFSKVYQELKLDFDASAELTAEAGLDGIDCPVRPGGEVLPERATDDMPRYAEALRKRKVEMLLLTTAILSPSTPHAEDILRAAKKLGIRYYRLGPVQMRGDGPTTKAVADLKAGLKDLAQLNKELGLTALCQNHSPSGKTHYLGGDLQELHEIVRDFPPEQIGVAFDLGHALIMYGEEWGPHFERLKSHLKVAYVKDANIHGRFTRFGEGDFKGTDWFTRLKAMGYAAPFSLHIEFDWDDKGRDKNRAALLRTLKESVATLRQWTAKA